MTKAEELADFTAGADFKDLSPQAVDQFKIRLPDSLNCEWAIAGSACNALRMTHIDKPSNWKPLAYANMTLGVVLVASLACKGPQPDRG